MNYRFTPTGDSTAAEQARLDLEKWYQSEDFKRRDAELTKRIAEMTAKRDAGELYSTAPSEQKTFTFTLSVSEKPYTDKNSIFWPAVCYERVDVSVDDFAEDIKNGFCFTSIFNRANLTLKDKTEANWTGSQFVVFDLDNVRPEVNLNTFVSSLLSKPTVAYTTPNNRIKKPSEIKEYSRFRLVYIFDSTITSKTQYQSIYNTIESNFPLVYFDNTKKKDNCGSSPVQQFAGNALPTCEMIVNEESIYSIFDFPSKPTEPSNPTEPSKPSTEPSKPSTEPSKPSTEPNMLNDTFFKDLNSMKPVNFFRKYINAYGIIEKPQIIYENGFYETTEDYVEIMRKYRKVYDAETQNYKTKRQRIPSGERHNTLFAYAKLRCQIKPEITLEELVFNSVYDRTYFCENDDKEITNECLIDICRAAKQANYTMKMKKRPKFKIDKSYCIANNINPCAFRQQIRRKLNFESIDTWYVPAKSVKENLIFAENNNIKVKKDTLYSYCKERRISTKGTKPTEPTEPTEPKPTPEPKPSTEPSDALEQKEAVQSAPEAKHIIRIKRANFLAFIEYHTKRKRYSKYQARLDELKTKTI